MDLVKELSDKMGPDLSIIHCFCEYLIGNLGNENREAYTALFPDKKSKLSKLTQNRFLFFVRQITG